MITNCSITLYNHYSDSLGKVWYKRTFIDKANWQEIQNKDLVNNMLQSADSINIFIPYLNKFENKTFLNYKAWLKLSEEDKNNYFTFAATDRIVKGECEFVFDATSKITTLDAMDNVGTIMSVINNDNGSMSMKHFQIGAK